MRILLYVEPHPIRDSLTHFDSVAQDFARLLSSPAGYDVRMFANDATYAKIKESLASFEPRLIRTTPQEDDYLNDCLKKRWTVQGLPNWVDLMEGKGEVADFQVEMLKRIWNLFPFEIIVHWGENGAISRFVEDYPVIRVAMELGCSRAPFFKSLIMDPFGTNGSAVIPKLSVEDIRKIVGNNPMCRHEALFSFSQDISVPAYSKQFEPLPSELDARRKDHKIAFLPLQLFDDANLVRFSRYKTLADVVLDVVPRLSDAGYFTVVKTHPASKQRKGALYENLQARRASLPWSSKVLWCDEETPISNTQLYTLADVVVTVNSSAGFEGLYFDKTVIVLGDSVYKPKDLFPSLDEVLSENFDRNAYLDSAGLLRRFMLCGYLKSDTLLRDTSSFCNNLSLILDLGKSRASTPIQFADEFWRASSPAQTSMARSAMLWGISKPGIAEFGSVAAPEISAPAPATPSASDTVKKGSTLPFSIIQNIKNHWLKLKAQDWIAENSASTRGRIDFIKSLVATDFQLQRQSNTELQTTDFAPIKTTDAIQFSEVNAKISELISMSEETFFRNLLLFSQNLQSNFKGTHHATGMDDATFNAYQTAYDHVIQNIATDQADNFYNWLSWSWSKPDIRAEIISISQLVEPEYYLEKYQDLRDAQVNPTHHFSFTGITEGRSPRLGVSAPDSNAYLDLFLLSAKNFNELSQINVYPLAVNVEALRQRQIQNIKTALTLKTNRIAVVAHLYYTDLVPEILCKLKNIKEPFDLIVTLPDWGTKRIETLIKSAYPEAILYRSANRGRDIGPFMDLLPILVEKDYDAVLKLQTKRGYFAANKMIPEYGDIWRTESLDALAGSTERISVIIEAFRSQPKLNMVGPEPFLVSQAVYPYHDFGNLADKIIGPDRAGDGLFFAGTMFWARPSCLQSLSCLNLTHFSPETGSNDGELAHLIERMFGDAAKSGGGDLACAPVSQQESLVSKPTPNNITLQEFFAQRKITIKKTKEESDERALFW